MVKVICIGSASRDIFFPTKEGVVKEDEKNPGGNKDIIFRLGSKYHIDNRFESLGGCAVNQAVGLSRLGQEVFCYSSLGSDDIGKWIEENLEKAGIRTELLRREENCPSGLSAIIVDQDTGERIIFSNQEANERLQVESEKLSGTDWVSVTDLSGDWEGVIDATIKFCSQKDIRVSFNPRRINIEADAGKVLEFARQCEVFFVNKEEAEELLGKMGIDWKDVPGKEDIFLVEKLREVGAKITIVTDGEKGAWVSDGSRVFFAQSLREKAVDSTGAGDAFSSGFLAGYLKGKDLEECARWGIVSGAQVVKYYGGVEGLPKEEEIAEKAREVKITNI